MSQNPRSIDLTCKNALLRIDLLIRDWVVGGGERLVAFATFDALAMFVAYVGMLADAARSAHAFQALLGHLGSSVDEEGDNMAAGNTIQLAAAFFHVGLTLRRAFGFSGKHGDHGLWCLAVGGWHAFTILVSQESFLAEAPDDAVLCADGAWMWVSTGGRASGAAGLEDFSLWALMGDGGALLFRDAFAIGASAEMSLFACATRDADAWADRVRLVARTITTLALTEFFVLTADWSIAFVGRDADAFAVLQVTRLAEAANHALESADGAWVRVGAGGGASRATGQELFVFLALLGREGEEHRGFGSLALMGWDADTVAISQVSFLAEASNHTVLCADRAGDGLGAGGGAGRSTSIEFFIVWARWHGSSHWDLHREFGAGLAVTFWEGHAFALFVLQVSFPTETAADTLEGTDWTWMHEFAVGTGRGACGATFEELCIWTASFIGGKSRDGNSEADGGKAEQQRESKARVHR
jgi:hypothetical protein